MKLGQIGKRLGYGWVVVFAYLSACTKWQVQQVSPQQLLIQGQPEKLRVSLVDNTEVVLNDRRYAAIACTECGMNRRFG